MEEKAFISGTEFFMINSEYRSSLKPPMFGFPNNLLTWRPYPLMERQPETHKEVFLCGPVGDHNWKAEIAYPYFR